jgi:hypothetical protein
MTHVARTKLTLRLDPGLIQRAKIYARRSGKSVSQMVADFFARPSAEPAGGDLPELTPKVRALKGALRGALDREDHRRHLEEKYR